MSFYGNIREDMTKSQFQFDRVYANRFSMDAAIGNSRSQDDSPITDGVFVGRFILVDYNLNPQHSNISAEMGTNPTKAGTTDATYYLQKSDGESYFTNRDFSELPIGGAGIVTTVQTIDEQAYIVYYYYYKQTDENLDEQALFHPEVFVNLATGYDGSSINEVETGWVSQNSKIDHDYYGAEYNCTVWQKIINGQKEEYLLVARLNSKAPQITLWDIGPSESPQLIEKTDDKMVMLHPVPWKVTGEVEHFGFPQYQDDLFGGRFPVKPKQNETTGEYEEEPMRVIGTTVRVEETRFDGISQTFTDADSGLNRSPQPNDVLNFIFSIPEVTKMVSEWLDLTYGYELQLNPNGTPKVNADNGFWEVKRYTDLNFYGDAIVVPSKNNGEPISTDDLTEDDWKEIGKQFDPTTFGGLINLIQLYLGKGAVATGASVEGFNSRNWARDGASRNPPMSADELRNKAYKDYYDHNLVLPENRIVPVEGVGIDKTNFYNLYYVAKTDIFTPINGANGFTVDENNILTAHPEDKAIYKKVNNKYEKFIFLAEQPYLGENWENIYYYISDYEYEFKKLMDGDSIIEILVQLYKKFNFDNPNSRDTNTIMGLFNELEDQVKGLKSGVRSSITWNVTSENDKAVMEHIFSTEDVEDRRVGGNPEYTLDEVIDHLGITFNEAKNTHLIKTEEDANNEMTARLVFGPRSATATDKTIISDIAYYNELDETEPQGIVYDGSIYKTSAVRFLDNNTEINFSQIDANTETNGKYYKKEIIDGKEYYIEVTEFSFDFTSQGANVYELEDSEQIEELPEDEVYDYFYLPLDAELYAGNNANNPGNGLSIGAGGLTILGSGESPYIFEKYVLNNPYNVENGIYPNTEQLEILSDEEIRFYAGLNGYKEEWLNFEVENNNTYPLIEAMREFFAIYEKAKSQTEILNTWKEQVANYDRKYKEYLNYRSYIETKNASDTFWQTVFNKIESSNYGEIIPTTKNYNGSNLWFYHYVEDGVLPERYDGYLQIVQSGHVVNIDKYYYYHSQSNSYERLNPSTNEDIQRMINDSVQLWAIEKTKAFIHVDKNGNNINVSLSSSTVPKIAGILNNTYTDSKKVYFSEISNGENLQSGIYFESNNNQTVFTPKICGYESKVINPSTEVTTGDLLNYIEGFWRYEAIPTVPSEKTYYKLNNNINLTEQVKSNGKIPTWTAEGGWGYDNSRLRFRVNVAIVTEADSTVFERVDKTNATFAEKTYIGRTEDNSYYLITDEDQFNAVINAENGRLYRIKWEQAIPDIEKYRVFTLAKDAEKTSLSIGKVTLSDIMTDGGDIYLKVNNSLVYDNRRVTYGTAGKNTDTDGEIGDIYIQLDTNEGQ